MHDPTEEIRREMVADLNAVPGSREALEAEWGRVWDSDELRADFEITGFLAPFCMGRRKSDGVKVSLMFQHSPRFYFGLQEDR